MKTLPFAALVLAASTAFAADVSYSPSSPAPYLWSDLANWSGGALPGSGDTAVLDAAALAASPVVLPAGMSVSVAGVTVGSKTSGQSGYNLFEIESGATLTTTDNNTGLVVGGATGIVTNYGAFTGRFRLGPLSASGIVNGTLARFDNFGTVSAGAFWMGLGNSKSNTDGTPSIFYNHAGATFGLTGGGYMSRDGGDSTFINEGTMSSSAILYMGLGKGRSELRIQGNGTFTANNEIRQGHGYASTSYVVLADSGSITGTGAISVGHGNGQKATGYLILSNNASIVKSAGSINLGTYTAGAAGHLQMNDSASITHDSYLNLGNSASTQGTVEMAGNSVFQGKTVVLANATNSTGVISMAGNSRFYPQALYIGGAYSAADNSQATMSLTDSAEAGIGNSLYVGMRPGARGTLSLAGDSHLSVTTNLFIGYNSGSTGTVSVAGNATIAAPSVSVGQGSATVALMTLADSATLFSTNIGIVSSGTATGTLEVGGDSVVTNLLTLDIGNASKCDATLAMRGGAIFLDIDPENPTYVDQGWFNPIRLNPTRTEACGRIRGWGKVAFSDPVTYVANAAQRPNGLTHHGQVIADGEGVARDLDFSRFGALNFSSTDANPSGTNGWFAVNKGRLRLPRSWPRKSDAAFCVGDHYSLDYSKTPGGNVASNRLANTFSATFTGAVTGNYLFADLYATDRDDIPGGLDEIRPDRVISVWRIGLFDDGPEADEPSTPSAFTSAELRLRIPGDAVADAEKLYVARHDGTANGKWSIVGRLVDPNPKWPVIPARVDAPSSEAWNLGWFVVIDRSTPFGTTFYIR